jgi:hypothetical protein
MAAVPQRCTYSELPLGAGADGRLIKYTNCFVFVNGELVNEDVWVRNGVIIDPATTFWQASAASEYAKTTIVDCQGHILSPGEGNSLTQQGELVRACSHELALPPHYTGFVDLQFNGAWGVDFSDPAITEEDVLVRHPAGGAGSIVGAKAVSFLSSDPSLLSCP